MADVGVAIVAGAAGSFADYFFKLSDDFVKRAFADSKQKKEIQESFKEHLESSFRKCSTVKTLLRPNTPSEMLQIYSDQSFRLDGVDVDHYGLIEIVRSNVKNIILTGTGGSGKSIFMKYLWLSLFMHSNGRVPIFIELRAINTIKDFDFISYLRHTLFYSDSVVTEAVFAKTLKQGDYIVLLDGFDEIHYDKRDEVRRQILEISERYPNICFVVSSRPDGDFADWPYFHVAKVNKLNKGQAIDLLCKSDFESDIKEKFIEEVERNLYSKYESFLSNPLLVCIMLLTYSHHFDIPERVHEFYEYAFSALYRRHDSSKAGRFKRKFYCEASETNFRRVFAYFCLMTYNRESFEFGEAEAIERIESALHIVGLQQDSHSYYRDLVESVCMLVVDGVVLNFAHRSFQEYFAAYCIASIGVKETRVLLSRFAKRMNDQVLYLVYQINKSVFRDKYALPVSEMYNKYIKTSGRHEYVTRYMQECGMLFEITNIDIHRELPPETKLRDHHLARYPIRLERIESDLFYLSKALDVVKSDYLGSTGAEAETTVELKRDRRRLDDTCALELFDLFKIKLGGSLTVTADAGEIVFNVKKTQSTKKSVEIRDSVGEQIFKKSHMYNFFLRRMKMTASCVTKMRTEKEREEGAIMEELELF